MNPTTPKSDEVKPIEALDREWDLMQSIHKHQSEIETLKSQNSELESRCKALGEVAFDLKSQNERLVKLVKKFMASVWTTMATTNQVTVVGKLQSSKSETREQT